MSDSGLPDVAEKLSGQTAVVTGDKDVAPVAKILKLFSAEFKITAVKIGVVDKSILSTEEIEMLAELPPRDVLLSQLLGLLLSPATKLVRLLNEPGSAFARLLNARASKMPVVEPAQAPTPEMAPSTEQAPPADVKEEVPKVEAAAESAPAAESKMEEPPAPEGAA
jgi:hypothetical protein